MQIDKSIKFLLAVIAINLTFLTISEFDLFPKAYANEVNIPKTPYVNYGLIPLNPDSTITVKFTDEQLNLLKPKRIQNVNLMQLNGKKPCYEDERWCHEFLVKIDEY